MYPATMSTKGQIVIPAPIRQKLNLKPRTRLIIHAQNGCIVLERAMSVEEACGYLHDKVDSRLIKKYRSERALNKAIDDAWGDAIEEKMKEGRL